MILLGADVLIDVALDRRPYSDPASELLDRIEHGAEAAPPRASCLRASSRALMSSTARILPKRLSGV